MRAMTARGTAVSLLAGCIALAVAGCYSYRGVEGVQSIAPGSRARAMLTPSGQQSFETRTGRRSPNPEGQVVGSDSDSLYVVVGSAVLARSGQAFGTGIDTVGIPLAHIAELQQKELDTRRTAVLMAAGGIALGAFVIWRFNVAGGSLPSSPVPPPGDYLRRPVP